MTAKSLCISCFWAKEAGAAGDWSQFALEPSSPTGHFQRKINKFFDVQNNMKPMMLPVPVMKFQGNRECRDIPFKAPHGELAAEADSEGSQQLKDAPLELDWASEYKKNPVVIDAKGTHDVINPSVLYVDGIRHTKAIS
eukprot:2000919-Pyramimonas_sp.AAC.1